MGKGRGVQRSCEGNLQSGSSNKQNKTETRLRSGPSLFSILSFSLSVVSSLNLVGKRNGVKGGEEKFLPVFVFVFCLCVYHCHCQLTA